MKLPTYILFKDDKEAECILQTPFPHYIGKVIQHTGDSWGYIAGYNLTVMFAGSFYGNHLVLASNMKQQLEAEMNAMAAWYLVEVIEKDLDRFSRYAL